MKLCVYFRWPFCFLAVSSDVPSHTALSWLKMMLTAYLLAKASICFQISKRGAKHSPRSVRTGLCPCYPEEKLHGLQEGTRDKWPHWLGWPWICLASCISLQLSLPKQRNKTPDQWLAPTANSDIFLFPKCCLGAMMSLFHPLALRVREKVEIMLWLFVIFISDCSYQSSNHHWWRWGETTHNRRKTWRNAELYVPTVLFLLGTEDLHHIKHQRIKRLPRGHWFKIFWELAPVYFTEHAEELFS